MLSLLFSSLVSAEGQNSGAQLILHGVVLDAITLEPVALAAVTLVSGEGQVFTSRRGSFEVSVPAGTTHLRIVRSGYLPAEVPTEGELLVVRLEPEPMQLEGVRVQRENGRFDLTGRVIDYESGRPIAGAGLEIRETRRSTFTDAHGRFLFRNIQPGSYTVRTRMLGYAEHEETSNLSDGLMLIVSLLPQPIVLEGVTVLGNVFQSRRMSVGYHAYFGGRADLISSSSSSIGQFLEDRFRIRRASCPRAGSSDRGCFIFRNWPRPISVLLDGDVIPLGTGLEMLDHFHPSDMYLVEFYPALGQVHLFTPAYVEMLARTGRRPPPICLVC